MKNRSFCILTTLLLSTLCSCAVVPNGGTTSEYVDPFPGYYEIGNGLYVNKQPGIYDNSFDLEFKSTDDDAKIYYTFDSSLPSSTNGKLYNAPFEVKSTNTNNINDYPLTKSVDAILSWDNQGKMISEDYINNIQKNGTYNLIDKQCVVTIKCVNGDGSTFVRSLSYVFDDYDIPVISLSMPYDNWFGNSNGFYNQIRSEIEHRVNFEYIDPEYDEYFHINSQIKLGGNYTIGYPQRIMNLNFKKDENGLKQDKVEAHIFKDRQKFDGSGTLDKFSRLRLHNGGNCFENYTGFNDAILQMAMTGTHAATNGYRPCVIYLNGEYWGLYSIREHYKPKYFASHYGVDDDVVAIYDYKGEFIFNDGVETDFTQYMTNLNNYLNKDFRDDNVYNEFINTYIDIDSFMDVMIAQLFVCNRDFVGNNNNLKAWRTTTVDSTNPYADGKLRFCLHDSDFAFTDASYWNFLDPDVGDSYSNFKMFKKLLQNQMFKDEFYYRAAELVETNLSYDHIVNILTEMTDEVRDYKLDSNNRWGLYYWGHNINGITQKGLAGWEYEIEYVKNFIDTRINNKQETSNENGNENERNFLEAIENSLKEY